jgi:integrase
LPKRAIKILKDIPRERGNDHVFVGAKRGSGLSNAAMAELLKGMHKARAKSGLPPWTDKDTGRLAVPHGFRSSFRDWAGDHTNFPRELIETAMSHKIKDKVEAAYRRTAALEKRRKLMESWSGYCASPKPEGKVVPMRGAA